MAFDSSARLYWDIKIGKKDPGFDTNSLTNLQISSSIFTLFPTVSFDLVNQENFYHAEEYAQTGAPLEMEIGTEQNALDLDILRDFILERPYISNSSSNLSGGLSLQFNNLNVQKMRTASLPRAFKDKRPDQVIQSILNDHKFNRNNTIEKTQNKGNWLKPSNQSDEKFLKNLKNRSTTAQGGKMFMWIDLEGGFNFKSLNKMLSSRAVDTIDFQDEDIAFLTPSNFILKFQGLHYNNEDVNANFKEYVFSKDAGKLVSFEKPSIKLLGSGTSNGITDRLKNNQTVFSGFGHSKLPEKYNEALYTNNTFDFLCSINFSISHRDGNPFVPGNVVKLKFPHHTVVDKNEIQDFGLSTDYLVTSVVKREGRGIYISDVSVITNAFGASDIKRFY